MKALITGATGFIGKALAQALAATGWEVTLLARAQSQGNLPDGPFRLIEADLAAPTSLVAALSGLDVDVVVHAAAIRNRWGTPPAAYYNVNVAATQALVQASSGHAGRFVYVSSVGVFGRPGVLNIDESFPVAVSSTWDYHSSKAAGERIVMESAAGLETVVVRPTITYGPGDSDGMVTRMMQMVMRRQFFRIGRGDNHVHLTYIADLLQGLILAMTHSGAPGNTFILAGPEPITMAQLLGLIENQVDVRLPKWYLPARAARLTGALCEMLYRSLPPSWNPPITRDKVDNLCANRGFSWHQAQQTLGYTPQYPYKTGLAHTFEWLKHRGR
jgi:nucleoside-diphosphate-sugar epimerase